jgi:glycerate kinase
MTRVLVAPDKFKGSLPAAEVAASLRRGLLSRLPDLDVRCLPVADGGDGTLDATLAAGFTRVPCTASGPTGEPVPTAYARRGTVAVVELAAVSGLAQLPGGVLRPLDASSRGTGEVIARAIADGCDRVVLGIGGSACTDGGAGLVQALGAGLFDEQGREVPASGGTLGRISRVSVDAVRAAVRDVEVIVACDVDNPLTGPSGAAVVYGPQKGATDHDVALLDDGLAHWADLVGEALGADHRDDPGAGAAGGVGFGALALLGARLAPGIDLMLALLDFESAVRDVDLAIVGEGSLDEQTLRGKAPVGVARLARSFGVPVVAVCGRLLLDAAALQGAGIEAAWSLGDREPDPAVCMREAAALLEAVGRDIAEARFGGIRSGERVPPTPGLRARKGASSGGTMPPAT